MTKQTILALAITLALASCNDNSTKTTKTIEQTSTKEVATDSLTLNGEAILKYGHQFSNDCSANSIDWPGSYVGATANKGNNYARLRLTLNKDWTYNLKIMSIEYEANGGVKEILQNETNGTFTFDGAGQIIKLIGTKHPLTNELISLRVGESYLSVLDGNLKELSNDGDMNALHKK